MGEKTAGARETSGATTRLVVRHVRALGGDAAVAALVERAAVPYTAEQLEQESTWTSYAERIRLFEAAVDVLGDPDAMFTVGASALRAQVNPPMVLLLRALGSPRQVFGQLPRAVPKFTTTSVMRIEEIGRTHAVIDYRLLDGYAHSRLDCQYTQGLFSCVPAIFGLPPATVSHDRCQSEGHPSCRYEVRWMPRSRLPWRRGRAADDGRENEVELLRSQLEALQSAAADLVSADDVDVVLQRMTDRAATAVLAAGYLLAVEDPYGGEPRVHWSGLTEQQARRLAPALLAHGRLGSSAVVADIATARRQHGRLAALYAPGQTGLEREREMLDVYARHAAAALDTVIALDATRRSEQRAHALLRLATALASVRSPQAVAEVVAAALPEVLGSACASVLLWDDDRQVLLPSASAGLTDEQRRRFATYELPPPRVPELADMLTDPRPRLMALDAAGPLLRQMFADSGVEEVLAAPIVDGGTLLGVLSVGRRPGGRLSEVADVVERLEGVSDQAATALRNARLVAQVRHQSEHDALTGLPNRVLFAHRTEQADRRRGDGALTALLFCDLDRFKRVNDNLGHAAGDELLRQVAQRLRHCIRDQDTVARLSGDEFAILLPHVAAMADAEQAAQRVLDAFTAPFDIDGHRLVITTSVGIAVGAEDDADGDLLLRHADTAMYEAKQRGRNQVAVFDATRAAAGHTALHLESELVAALAGLEFRVVYQPVVELPERRLVGVEALLRWAHPTRGLLPPAEFMAAAESSGAIVGIDLYVLDRACAQAARWRADGVAIRVAVNLSGQTVVDPRLLPAVADALARHGLPADALELEVLESSAFADLGVARERLDALHALGVRLALDDFGTGQTSISWLRQFPVSRLKVERSFVAGIADDPSDHALVKGIVALGEELGFEVLAEGVETEEQAALLVAAGCRLAQGYLFGRPTEADRLPGPLPLGALAETTPAVLA